MLSAIGSGPFKLTAEFLEDIRIPNVERVVQFGYMLVVHVFAASYITCTSVS